MLNHVYGAQRIEGRVAERIRKTVEVAQYVGARSGEAVDAKGASVHTTGPALWKEKIADMRRNIPITAV